MSIGEKPIPRYVLTGLFEGERWDEGYGGGKCEIAHVPVRLEGELMVEVVTRLTSRRKPRGPRVALPAALARRHVALGLMIHNPSAGDDWDDWYAAADEITSRDDAWKARQIVVDNEVMEGYEAVLGERWVAYYLTPLLIVSVRGPVALRPATVELRELRPDEVLPSRLVEE
jgi:hypothetical protein